MAKKATALSDLSDDDVLLHYHHTCRLTALRQCSQALTVDDATKLCAIFRAPALTEDVARAALLRYMLAHHQYNSRDYRLLGVDVCKTMFILCTSASKEKIRICMPCEFSFLLVLFNSQ